MPNAYRKVRFNNDKSDRIRPSGADTIFSITPMIAFRDSTNQPWTISILSSIKIGGNTKERSDRGLAEFCFINLKNFHLTYTIQNGPHKRELHSKPR